MKNKTQQINQIGWFRLGFTFCGCFLGAGFVSGQEIWQFFGSFGSKGLIGLLLAMVILSIFGVVTLQLARKSRILLADRMVIRQEKPLLRNIVGGALSLFLFTVVVIMSAGASALLQYCLHIPVILGSLLFCLAVGLISLFGTKGMITSFSLLVPFMVLMTVGFSILAVSKNPPDFMGIVPNADNPLLNNWLLAAFSYVSYNMFGSISILTPVAHNVKHNATVMRGVAFGGVLLLLISGGILLAIASHPQVAKEELPMLALAVAIIPSFGYIYALLLLCGMFGAALSCSVGLMLYLEQKLPAVQHKKKGATAVILILAWAGSLVGFGDLISVIYPIFGYIGMAALISMLCHYFYIKKHQK